MKKGIYRHYKGKLYLVLSEGLLESTLSPMVVYQALYGEYTVWIREKEDFLQEVTAPEYDYNGPRFCYLRDWSEQDSQEHPERPLLK